MIEFSSNYLIRRLEACLGSIYVMQPLYIE
jgi:hypothetical protein